MNMKQIIHLLGGRAAVGRLIGVSPQYVSQMKSQHRFADHHLRLFIALRPELDWSALLGDDYHRFAPLYNDKYVKRLRVARTRKHKTPIISINNINLSADQNTGAREQTFAPNSELAK
jgi:hypothetical protein